MSNIAKLKKKAAEFEARKQYDKALEVYEQVLNSARTADEDRDVPLYNRVGDLHYRIGNNEQALGYYEQAADLYAEGGFFNNAIALCNKILRYSPGRTIIYYKLGIISAKKGFNSDAKQNFLEYADRMQKLGKMDEAFRALKEFADLCPGQDDVRLMLAEQLARANRKSEALEQLEMLHETLEEEGRSAEAAATLERMKALDPAFQPRRSVTPRARKKEGLVFLDLDFDHAPPPAAAEASPSPHAESAPPVQAMEGLELTALADEPVAHATPTPDSEVAMAAPSREEADEKEDEDEPAARSSNELHFITPAEENAPTLADFTPIDLPTADYPPIAQADAGSSAEAPPEPEFEQVTPMDFSASDLDLSASPPLDIDAMENGDLGLPDSPAEEGFIDLGEWLASNRTPSSTRMVTHDEEPENDEQKDFNEMLGKFKEGISRNVDEEDFESHYDLGIAFREMGLLDEAIGSFQKASRGVDQRVRASEAIGQCFMDKGEAAVTVTVLERLLRDPDMSDGRMVGVLYLLGRAAESLGRPEDAAGYYQRVLAVQIGFRDAAGRLSSLAQASR